MVYTIVPALNEGNKIDKTLNMLHKTNTDKILVVINGCNDNTYEKVSSISSEKLQVIYFDKPLGLDVPRAVGAYYAYREGACAFIFVDGDMIGDISLNINEIIDDIVLNNVDMGLTDCYSQKKPRSSLAKILLSFRKQLNIELGIFENIGCAIPSHGPHGISRTLIETIGFRDIAIPPVSLALAVINKLKVKVSTRIPNYKLKSTIKDEFHAEQIAKTIIGDCIEALTVFRGEKRKRGFDGMDMIGYHKNRRFDILDSILAGIG